jgi:futalosine hydrolase
VNVLVVTAVTAERDAILAAGPNAHVIVVGVGPAEAAAGAAHELAGGAHDLVLCAGIGGGFAPLGFGDIAVAARSVFADLGVEADGGFQPIDTLGFGTVAYDVEPRLSVELADAVGGHLGTILTVATVTGTAETSAALLERWPDAVAEGMEGAGVAAAAARAGVPFAEIRAISNTVGPRDRESWDIPAALASLGRAVGALATGAGWTS